MNLNEIIDQVYQLFPEFSREEIAELCFDYLAQFNEKTKESTKEKSLKKISNQRILNPARRGEWGKSQTFTSFSSIPRYLFSYTNKKNADYLITIRAE